MQFQSYAFSPPVPTWRPAVEQGDKPMLTPVPAIFTAINEAVDSAYTAGREPLMNDLLRLKLTITHEYHARHRCA